MEIENKRLEDKLEKVFSDKLDKLTVSKLVEEETHNLEWVNSNFSFDKDYKLFECVHLGWMSKVTNFTPFKSFQAGLYRFCLEGHDD